MPSDRLYLALRERRERGWWKVLSRRALLLDLCLLERYNWQKAQAWPSFTRIRADTKLCRASITEALAELEFYGLWHRQRRPGENGPRRRTNVYTLPPTVPEVPGVRYSPGEKWRRPERLKRFKNGRSRAVDSTRSSAVNLERSRAVDSYRSRALDCELRIRTTQLNNEENNAAATAADCHLQPQNEKQDLIQRHRSFWFENGEGEETFPGVRRALAAALRCTEEEAGALLRGYDCAPAAIGQ